MYQLRNVINASKVRKCTYQLHSAWFLGDVMRSHFSRQNSGNPAQMMRQHSCHQSAYKTENITAKSHGVYS
jgi:hypothetical protein